MPLTIEEILQGTTPGQRQSVGVMEVIPICGEDDETFSPPDVEVGTSNYGTVDVRNTTDRTTFVPPGAGWVVKSAAQDHAIGGGVLVPPKRTTKVNTAMCIQETQGGYISKEAHEMLILPLALRVKALEIRKEKSYSKLWDNIRKFNNRYGIDQGGHHGHLEYFLNQYNKQLDQFVAEFELVPNQIGAIILINNVVVGIEMAPSAEFWKVLWTPLIRVCYGSVAVQAAQKDTKSNRVPLILEERSLTGLTNALYVADTAEQTYTEEVIRTINPMPLTLEPADQAISLGNKQLAVSTVKTTKNKFSGQIVTVEAKPKYASLCAKI